MSFFYTDVSRLGSKIAFRGYKDGKRIERKIDFTPTLYVPSKEPTEFKTLTGKYVSPINPGTMGDCYQFIKQYEDVEGFEIYGNQNYVHQFISDIFQESCTWDKSLVNITSIDIEVKSDKGFPHADRAAFPITAITLTSSTDNKYFVWGLGDWCKENSINQDLDIIYVKCEDEKELLLRFIAHWERVKPDILTGWNSRLFDTVYIINRLKIMLGEEYAKKMSPWGSIRSGSVVIKGRENQLYEIAGVQQLDYLDLFKKFTYGTEYFTPENHRLDTIAHMVLGLKKLDYSEYASLNELYINNHQKFIDYNIRDTQLIPLLDDKMGLIELCMTIAYKGLVNYAESFGPVNLWDAFIYNEFKKNNIVIPPRKFQSKDRQIAGGHVKDPIPGMYRWVVSFDLNALYPHLIMQYNLSPETIMNQVIHGIFLDDLLDRVPLDIPKDMCMTALGQLFSTKERGFFPKLVEKLYNERVHIKGEMLKLKQEKEKEKNKEKKELLDKRIVNLNNQQMAVKILMNSLYGAMSNEYFRYYDNRIAESITLSGQLTIRWAERSLNAFFNKTLATDNVDYVIAIDTDSLYIDCSKLVAKLFPDAIDTAVAVKVLDEFCSKKIEPLLEKAYQELKEYLQAYAQKMVMKREVIADKGIWTGKKHYILNVWNSEGVQYKEPDLKIMGLEAVKSSTPNVCRKMIKDSIKVIMNSDEKGTQEYIQKMREHFFEQNPEDIAFPRGVSDLEKYADRNTIYTKGTPIHCRGALLYNKLLKHYSIESKYPPIQSGDKLKFVYLKTPNSINENVIAFQTVVPEEFQLKPFVNYDVQFEKSYLEPMKSILNTIHWSAEKRATLEALFG